MNESQQLAAFLAEARFPDLPRSTVSATSCAVLDWFGSGLAGSREEPARLVREVVARLGTSGEATLFPEGRSSAAGAALANGAAAHILELDDIHKGSTVHGAAPIVSAALAVAERERTSGADFLLAAALGYEAALRIGEAVNPSHYRFWHPTGTVATFGAAAAAGSLLRLDAGQLLHALGSAGTQASGLWEFNADGAMSKHLHPGKAAFNGILAADLAKFGFTGASRILEGERGFFAATCDDPNPNLVTRGLGDQWKVEENGYKLHACCGHTHTAVDSALSLRKELGWHDGDAAREIAEIRIALYGPGYAIVRESSPRTPYQAKFSIAYCVAAALAEGAVGLDQFAPERFDAGGVCDPVLAALLGRTSVAVDDALTARYPRCWPSRLTIMLADGRRLDRETDVPLGHAENPVPRSALEAKCEQLIASRFDDELAACVIRLVDDLEQVADIATAMRDLFAVPRPSIRTPVR